MKLQLGHDGAPVMIRENVITGAPLARCPMRDLLEADPALSAEIGRMQYEYFPMFKLGHLLEDGGLANQPARYVDYMRHLHALDRRVQANLETPDNGEG